MRPRHAIILAAGMGTRLRPIGHHGPKGALVLHQRSIVEDSVQRLLHAGIERITLVTGYQADFYRSLADSMPAAINCVHNPEYADSGSMYSLYLAREQVDGDFLLLESDLIYEQRALSVVLFLINDLGFPPERLAATGFGEYRPVVPGSSPAARAQNRRIELKLTER